MTNYFAEILKPEDEEEYIKFLQKQDYLIEHTSKWGNILEKNFAFTPLYLIVKNEAGEIKAALPLFEAKSFLFGKRIVSTPYTIYTGLISENREAAEIILEAAQELTKDKKAQYLEIRSAKKIFGIEEKCFLLKKDLTNFYLNLNQNLEDIWKNFPKSIRSGIKKAQKNGLVIRESRSNSDLDLFYRLFLNTRKYRGVPAYPYQMFKDILENFPEETKIFIVEKEKEPLVAGIFYFYNKKVRYAYVGARHENDISLMRPYHLLLWEVIKFSQQNGFKVINFGGATKLTNDGGLYSFKEQWSSKQIETFTYFYLNKAKKIPNTSTNSKKFQTVSKIWNKMPLLLIKHISPWAIRQFV